MAGTLSASIYAKLKDEILDGIYFENDLLSEQQTADKFGVSKTTAREALLLLCQDGLLNKVPQKGYFVRRISKQDYEAMQTTRFIVECGALTYIVDEIKDNAIMKLRDAIVPENYDYDNFYEVNLHFHVGLVALTENEHLSKYHETLMRFLQRPSQYRTQRSPLDRIVVRHVAILDALLERDLDKAVRLLRADIYG